MRVDQYGNKISDEDDYCPNCDAFLEDYTYEWCTNCGEFVGFIPDSQPLPVITVDCVNCGCVNDITNNVCTNCGKNPTNGLVRCNPHNLSVEGLECLCKNCGEYNSIFNTHCYSCNEKLSYTINLD